MKLRVFLPASDRPDESVQFAWKLFDARNGLLREGACALADAPRASRVEAVIPAERVLFARLKLPKVNAATIRELLPFAVEDRLLGDPANIHAVAGRRNEHGETVVAVVDRAWLRAALDTLARAGLQAGNAWCESELLAGGHADWHVVLGAARGMLVDDEGVAATFDRAAGLPLAVRVAIDEAAQRGERPEKVRVHYAEGVALPDLEGWSREGGVPFEPGTRWETLAAGQPAALQTIEMLQGEFAPRSAHANLRLPRAALWLAGAVAALQLGFTGADAWRLAREHDALQARAEAIFRGAFPEARVVVDPELQMTRNLAELRRTRGLAAGDEFLARMTEAARGTHGRVRSVEYANGKVTVR